jgi:hypothetical protein
VFFDERERSRERMNKQIFELKKGLYMEQPELISPTSSIAGISSGDGLAT